MPRKTRKPFKWENCDLAQLKAELNEMGINAFMKQYPVSYYSVLDKLGTTSVGNTKKKVRKRLDPEFVAHITSGIDSHITPEYDGPWKYLINKPLGEKS